MGNAQLLEVGERSKIDVIQDIARILDVQEGEVGRLPADPADVGRGKVARPFEVQSAEIRRREYRFLRLTVLLREKVIAKTQLFQMSELQEALVIRTLPLALRIDLEDHVGQATAETVGNDVCWHAVELQKISDPKHMNNTINQTTEQ